MAEPEPVIELPDVEPKLLAGAIRAVAVSDTSRAARLREGAAQSVAGEPSDPGSARAFQTMLELGYLVASADGFAEQERASLAALLESITGAVVDHAVLQLHFFDLDEAVESLGRRERLARAAAEIDGVPAAEEALALAALIALADGRLSGAELEVLVDLGEHLSIPADRVRALVQETAGRVEAELS